MTNLTALDESLLADVLAFLRQQKDADVLAANQLAKAGNFKWGPDDEVMKSFAKREDLIERLFFATLPKASPETIAEARRQGKLPPEVIPSKKYVDLGREYVRDHIKTVTGQSAVCLFAMWLDERAQSETTARQTKTSAWHAALLAEIEAQKALIERMDNPRNYEMRNNGIMTVLRAERLDLLEKLREYEPAFSEKSGEKP